MIKRYKQLYDELRLLEHQLKEKCLIKKGRTVAFKIVSGGEEITSPKIFKDILKNESI